MKENKKLTEEEQKALNEHAKTKHSRKYGVKQDTRKCHTKRVRDSKIIPAIKKVFNTLAKKKGITIPSFLPKNMSRFQYLDFLKRRAMKK